MCLAKRRKTLFVFFLVASLVLTTTLGAAPNLSQAKKKKQGITVTNKMTKGVLVIREKKKLQLKLKLRGKKVSSKKIKKIFKFRSSNKKIVTVNKKGKIYAKKAGNAKVYITQKAKGKKKKCKLKVKVVAKKNKPVVTVTTESTKQPTVDQTKQPTAEPTKQPTAEPTKQPTAEPSKQPTAEPSKQPTAEPSKQPTAEPTKQPTAEPTPTPSASQEPQLVNSGECSKMTCGGPYTKPEAGKDYVTLWGNGDYCSTSYEFEGTNKKYRMVVKGASSNSSTASVSVYIGGKKVGTVGFTGTTLSEQSLEFKMTDVTGKQEIKFLLETDNGSNDTYVNSYELYYIGDVKPLPDAPIPASVGAVSTGKYRNLFKELGYSDAEIDKKVESAWQKFFYGTDDERIYYPVGEDMAYIYTADTDDVRSEGMSYGMMICVQMDKQEEFNRLWKWAKTHMQHKSGEFKGYFAWQMNTNGTIKDNTPAADGEEYFATSLLFASARWGNGEGIYNYNKEAQEILTTMLHQADDGQGVNMFNKEHKMPVFCPIGKAATYSDPSYHLPAFYEVWAREAEQDKDFWSEAAEASRQHFKDATNEKTGLGPDYSEYSGAAKNEGNHGDFRFDAWRIAANIACDYAWWAQDDWATTHANRIQSFFYDQGVDSYGNQWSLDGKNLSPDHSPGLVAMNATASLASSDKKSWSFLEDLWNISPTTGKYRYYDGCLYMMGLLHCSGKFRAYLSSNTPVVNDENGKISTKTAEFDKNADKKEDVTTKLILNGGRTLSEIRNDKTVLVEGKDYTISGNTVSICKEYLSKQAVGVTKLTFVFDAGKNAVMSITIKDSKSPDVPDVPAVSGPFDKIKATDCAADSKDIKVEDGKVTLNTTDSYIAFDIDFGSETAKSITTYVKEPNNSGQLFVRIGSLTSSPARIYNLGNGSWKEVKNSLWPTVTGKTKIYIQANKPGVQIDWIQFGK